MGKLFRRLYYWIRSRRARRELDQELEFHRALKHEDFERSGLSTEEARTATQRALGSVQLARDDVRAVWVWPWADQLWSDSRYAARVLIKNPGITAVAIFSLAIAIGGTTAVYSVVDLLLNRSPAGVADPDRLVTLTTKDTKRPDMGTPGFSYIQYEEARAFQNTFGDIAVYGKFPGVISDDERTGQYAFEMVSGNYFDVLGLRPEVGRLITPADDKETGPFVAVLSYRFWKSQFGADPGIIGRTIRLNGQVCEVIGVTPEGFDGYSMEWNGATTVWVPVHATETLFRTDLLEQHGTWGSTFFPIVGRLRPGLTFDVAAEQVQSWPQQLMPPAASVGTTERYHPDAIEAIRTSNARVLRRRDEAGDFLQTLLMVCGLVLFAACFNVANFLLGRAATRRRELAICMALGASRIRLCRQLMTEAVLIGLAASAVGFLFAAWLTPILAATPAIVLRQAIIVEVPIDLRMMTLAMGLGLLSALIFGLIPAVLASFRDPNQDIKTSAPHWGWSRIRPTPRQIMLVFQVALSVALAVTAGLYARSFGRIAAVDSGDPAPESLLIARLAPYGLPAAQAALFQEELLSRLNSMSPVVSATIGSNRPYRIGSTYVSLPENPDGAFLVSMTSAGPRFAETVGLRIVAGRSFNASDNVRTALLINEILADKFWPGQDPIGRSVLWGADTRIVTGVVAEDRCTGLLMDPHPCGWLPFRMGGTGVVRIRTQGDATAFAPALRELVHELRPEVAVTDAKTFAADIAELTATQRMSTLASITLAFLAMALLAIGCASLFVSMVRDSVREIAIRIALGASQRKLTARIVSHGMLLTAAGMLVGIGLARFIANRISDQLYRTDTTDPLAFAGTSLLILMIGLVSVYWSAGLAMKTDPAKNLRSD